VTGRAAWTAANAVMTLMFAASVVVQYNDPDPLAWMLMYGSAMVVAGLEVVRRARGLVAGVVGLVALGWAASIAPRVVGKVPFGDMFGAFEMRNTGIEESREMYGLLLIAIWMAAVALAARRRDRRSSGASR
jgi:hypothetical protein